MGGAPLPNIPVDPVEPTEQPSEPLHRRDSEDHTSTPVTIKVPHGSGGYSPLEDVELAHDIDSTPAGTEDQQRLVGNSSPDTSSLRSSIQYNHRDSRKFLLWTGINRLCVTLFLCIVLCLILRSYEGFNNARPRILSEPEVKGYNALMVGLSLALGMNIAASLKHYGSILRWSLLTRRYVPLHVFDLLLGCDSLINVFTLMLISMPGYGKLSFLPCTRRLKARKDKPKFTWLVCLLWLLINVGAQILVATITIFWPISPDRTPLLTRGDVSVSDLVAWVPGGTKTENVFAANTFGYVGSQYDQFNENDLEAASHIQDGKIIIKGKGYYEYTFLNRNPDALTSDFVPSSRKVRSKAVCQQLAFPTIGQGAAGVLRYGNDSVSYVLASPDGGAHTYTYPIVHSIAGQISWTGLLFSDCGPGCRRLEVYQRSRMGSDDEAIAQNSFFKCNSTVESVPGSDNEFSKLNDTAKAHILMSDDFARNASGAIAWTGYTEGNNETRDRMCKVYSGAGGMSFMPSRVFNTTDVEDIISRFSIGAVAAFDSRGPRYNIANQNNRPVQGQRLHVDWTRTLIILAWICTIQLCALVTLIAAANKSIIRDDSFFSLAMLLSPVISRINKDEGMNLRGEEIYNHPNLKDQRIRYDYVKLKVDGRKLRRVDIAFAKADGDMIGREKRRVWEDGEYI